MDSREPPVHQRLLRRVLSQPVTTVADVLVPAVADAVDVNDAVSRIEINELIDRIDIEVLMSKVDVDALLARVDVDALLARVDVDALLARVDVDALVQRVDVDALVQRVDVGRMVERLTGPLVGRTTGSLLVSFLDLLRRQLVGLDVIAMRLVDRLHRHRREAIPSGPDVLRPHGLAAGEVTGRYAGPASRLAAFGVDVGVVLMTFGIASALLSFLAQLAFGYRLTRGSGVWWTVAYLAWWFAYLLVGQAIAGRTVGKLIVGLRVVSADGHPITPRRALVRTVAFPLSFAFFLLGFLIALFQAQRRALHDLLAGTCEVYDWGDRPAQLPTPLTSWLSRHGALQVENQGRPRGRSGGAVPDRRSDDFDGHARTETSPSDNSPEGR